MSSFAQWAARFPDRRALTMVESGQGVSFGELADGADRTARWLVRCGQQAGDGIALLMENHPSLIEMALAARQAGLYYTTLNTHLTAVEAGFILRDCGARLLLVTPAMVPLAQVIGANGALEGVRVLVVGTLAQAGQSSFESLDSAMAASPLLGDEAEQLALRPVGRDLMYSSGTTGLPKGIQRAMVPAAQRDQPDREVAAWQRAFGFDEHSVYLSTAPFYHAAPLRYLLRTLDVGGQCVALGRFEPEVALRAIQDWRVTHSQWVPTMFVRLLKLPSEVRDRYDLSSHRMAVHAAAPCPVPVKHALMAWWGDIVHEYYAGSEGLGATSIGPAEWRDRPGSVGRAMVGQIRIVGGDGRVLPDGEVGQVYFADGPRFAYLNDPDKTRAATNAQGWASYGDMGHVDAEGYLFLSDRRADLILCGGMNIYPQEVERVLAQHPAVDDVAVVGVADDELGEVPKAVVCLRDGQSPSVELAQALVAHCAMVLSRQKLPRSVVFEQTLPRLETGKLLRRVLKDRYRDQAQAGFVLPP